MFSRLLPTLLFALLALAAPPGLRAQECAAGVISHIFIDNKSIFDLDELSGSRLAWAFELANSLHMKTRQSFLRRELLFHTGDCYDPFLVADQERILRRLPFISNAEVYGIRQPDDSWHVIVETRDEWSTRVEASVEVENGLDVRSLSLSEKNLLGRGFEVTAFMTRSDANQQVGGEFFTPQLFGTETDFRVGGGTTEVGIFRKLDVTYPFVGERGRYAWRVASSLTEDYFDYSSATPRDRSHVLLSVEERRMEFTGALRFGSPGNLSVLGLGISREELDTRDFPSSLLEVAGGDFDNPGPAGPETVDAVVGQTFFASGTRVNILFGQRNITFIQRTGLDALRGVADLEVGSDISLTLGRTVGAVGREDTPDDIHARFRFYAATAPAPFTIVSQFGIEGRQVFFDPASERQGWRDLLAELDVLVYWQPERWSRHTFLARLAAGGGWAVDRPFQVTLGGATGLRGFHGELYPGAQEAVLNLEDRLYLGWPFPDLFDLGLTFFGDLGRIFPGDVPFGVDSGWKGSLGAGLRLGFPSGSRGVARIDLAWPVGAGSAAGGPILRISLADLIGLGGGLADPQLNRSRLLLVGPDRFLPSR